MLASNKPQATSHKPRLAFKGFTLSELLVSLAVLGLIAGLTVPNIVASVEKSKNTAIAKELYQLISDVVRNGVMNGDFASMTNYSYQNSTDPYVQYFTSKFNATQCPKGNQTMPCNHNYASLGPTASDNNHSARWAFPNGSKIQFDVNISGSQAVGFNIDTKSEHNNSMGSTNQAPIICNVTESTHTAAFGVSLKGGQCLPYPGDSRASALGLL